MSTRRLSQLSTQYLRVPVYARRSGAEYDPTSDVVEFALMLKPDTTEADQYNEPASGDWGTGAWETDGGINYALINAGPSGTITWDTTGSFPKVYQLWIKITSTPEVPVEMVGEVVIY